MIEFSFVYNDDGFQITGSAHDMFNKLPKKKIFLQGAFASIQSKINVLTNKELIFGRQSKKDHEIIVEKNFPMGKDFVYLVAILDLVVMDLKKAVVKVELFIMAQSDYERLRNARNQ